MMNKIAYERGVLSVLARFKLASPMNPAASFKNMVRGGGKTVVESAARNPFTPLGKGAVPAVQRQGLTNPFARGIAQARPIPGFAGGQAPVTQGLAGLGGVVPPQAAGTGAFSGAKPIAAASTPAPSTGLRARLQAARRA